MPATEGHPYAVEGGNILAQGGLLSLPVHRQQQLQHGLLLDGEGHEEHLRPGGWVRTPSPLPRSGRGRDTMAPEMVHRREGWGLTPRIIPPRRITPDHPNHLWGGVRHQ